MRYTITYGKEAARQMGRITRRDPQAAKRIARAVAAMADDPFAGDVKRMKNVPFYRRRVGDWRIIFDIDGERLVIEIIKVGHRREVYRR